MNALTENITIVRDNNGNPAFVVLPFADWQAITLGKSKADKLIPNEVIKIAMIDGDTSATFAWRKYLGITQEEMAGRLGITQAAYSMLESRKTIRKSSREKIAAALGVLPEQLEW